MNTSIIRIAFDTEIDESEKAIRVTFGPLKIWLPKSQFTRLAPRVIEIAQWCWAAKFSEAKSPAETEALANASAFAKVAAAMNETEEGCEEMELIAAAELPQIAARISATPPQNFAILMRFPASVKQMDWSLKDSVSQPPRNASLC